MTLNFDLTRLNIIIHEFEFSSTHRY